MRPSIAAWLAEVCSQVVLSLTVIGAMSPLHSPAHAEQADMRDKEEQTNLDKRVDAAFTLAANGDPRTAVRAFQAVLNVAPDHARAHYGRGRVLASLGRYEQALKEFRQAEHLGGWGEESEMLILDGQARVALALGRPEEAVRLYKTKLEKRPDNPVVHFWMAEALYDAGRYAEAWEQVHAFRKHLFEGEEDVLRPFTRRLAEKMPEPKTHEE